jgi:hypothetical protein
MTSVASKDFYARNTQDLQHNRKQTTEKNDKEKKGLGLK